MVKKYTIEIAGENESQIKEMATLVQFALDNTDSNDLLQLFKTIEKKPSVVKKALKYIHLA